MEQKSIDILLKDFFENIPKNPNADTIQLSEAEISPKFIETLSPILRTRLNLTHTNSYISNISSNIGNDLNNTTNNTGNITNNIENISQHAKLTNWALVLSWKQNTSFEFIIAMIRQLYSIRNAYYEKNENGSAIAENKLQKRIMYRRFDSEMLLACVQFVYENEKDNDNDLVDDNKLYYGNIQYGNLFLIWVEEEKGWKIHEFDPLFENENGDENDNVNGNKNSINFSEWSLNISEAEERAGSKNVIKNISGEEEDDYWDSYLANDISKNDNNISNINDNNIEDLTKQSGRDDYYDKYNINETQIGDSLLEQLASLNTKASIQEGEENVDDNKKKHIRKHIFENIGSLYRLAVSTGVMDKHDFRTLVDTVLACEE